MMRVKMKLAAYYGCNIPARLPWYARAVEEIFASFDVGVEQVEDFACCGYPLRNLDSGAAALAAARNLALAEARELDMVVFCACCHGSLRAAQHRLNRDRELFDMVNRELRKEGLEYTGKVRIRHYLAILYREIGVDRIRQAITEPMDGMVVAAQYGCRLLRPSNVVHFDDPGKPRILDELIEATGARTVEWELKLECCGAPLAYSFRDYTVDWAHRKMESARESGAEVLCSVCPYCYLYFNKVLQGMKERGEPVDAFPELTVYAVLLARAMGIGDRLAKGRLGRFPDPWFEASP
ncbi:MAG: heterodisulfide reductase-related iron-sulfur binding cluster [Desulfatibacillaceae bacterium]